jgi:hypothetical protein
MRVLVDLGYPPQYVLDTVHNNKANYCLAGYYLLGID